MKNFLKHILIVTIFFCFTSIVNAADPCPPDMVDCETSDGGSETGGGTGGRKVPINDFAPLLVITAITIAGVVSYKQRQLIKK